TSVSADTWNRGLRAVQGILPRSLRVQHPGEKLYKLAEVLCVENDGALYWDLVSHWKAPAKVVLGAMEPVTVLTDRSRWVHGTDFRQQMMFLDLITYLPDDILVKVDRASMGVSLESRAPFLDHGIVEFAWRIPADMRVKQGRGKWPLRQLLDRYVPRTLVDRPKMGFGVPIDHWLRGPLREWATMLLDPSRLKREGFFDPGPIGKKWA